MRVRPNFGQSRGRIGTEQKYFKLEDLNEKYFRIFRNIFEIFPRNRKETNFESLEVTRIVLNFVIIVTVLLFQTHE